MEGSRARAQVVKNVRVEGSYLATGFDRAGGLAWATFDVEVPVDTALLEARRLDRASRAGDRDAGAGWYRSSFVGTGSRSGLVLHLHGLPPGRYEVRLRVPEGAHRWVTHTVPEPLVIAIPRAVPAALASSA